MDELAARVVRVEAVVQGLQQGAQAALADLLAQAQREFTAQRDSLLTLRADVQQEATTLRTYLEETRQATERLYAGASSGFVTLQGQVQEQARELARLAALAAAQPPTQPPPATGAPDPHPVRGC